MELSPQEREAFGDYKKHTKNHSLEVLRDDAEYRHLRFSDQGSNIYRFDLITWPGYLTICGDMGTYTFSRVRDMLTFFRDESGTDIPGINPHYWSEKLESIDKNSQVREFSPILFKQALRTELEGLEFESDTQFGDLWERVEEEILSDDYGNNETLMVSKAMEFDAGDDFGSVFCEIYEHDCKEFTFHYLWVLYAIVDGIRQYDALKAAEEKAHKEFEAHERQFWTPSEAIRTLDARMKVFDLEEAGLVVEGKDEFTKLIHEGGVLFEPLCAMLREGRKHGVSLSPRDRSFYDANRAKEALTSVFDLTETQTEQVMQNLAWHNTDRFDQGEIPENWNSPLILVDEESLTITEEGMAIILTECHTSLTWKYELMPADALRKNTGEGAHTAAYGYYNSHFPAIGGMNYATREDAMQAALGGLRDGVFPSREGEGEEEEE